MYKIAIKMLIRSRAKFYAMVFGMAACSMMMAQQPAIFMGIMIRAYSIISDIPEVDIWVVKKGVQNIDDTIPLRDNDIYQIKRLENVKWAIPFYKGVQKVKMQNGVSVVVNVIGADDVSLIGIPQKIASGIRDDIRKTDAIFIDDGVAQEKLFKIKDGHKQSLQIGNFVNLNEKMRVVVGHVHDSPNMLAQPTIYTTYSKAIRSSMPERNRLTAILVKVKEGADPEEVAERITKETDFKAYTRQEFANSSFRYVIKNSSIMESFGIGIIFIFIVSVVILGTTFYNFVAENILSLATLKAMGVDNATLTKMTILQSVVNGVVGFIIGTSLAILFGIAVAGGKVGYILLPQMIIFSALVMILICLISAYLGLSKIRKSEPAMVFKGN